jgi:hypothetical protein
MLSPRVSESNPVPANRRYRSGAPGASVPFGVARCLPRAWANGAGPRSPVRSLFVKFALAEGEGAYVTGRAWHTPLWIANRQPQTIDLLRLVHHARRHHIRPTRWPALLPRRVSRGGLHRAGVRRKAYLTSSISPSIIRSLQTGPVFGGQVTGEWITITTGRTVR